MDVTRRKFVVSTGMVALGAGVLRGQSAGATTPWYERCNRWCQVNATEKDTRDFDIPWWREQWKRTAVDGIIMNGAGAVVTQYPSKYPFQTGSRFAPGRDLFGELAEAGHRDGLAVICRMDSGSAPPGLLEAHPDWATRTRDGQTGGAPCFSGPFRDEYCPALYKEIIERSHPEAFTDNAGFGGTLCYCDNCARRFRDKYGKALPVAANWDDPVYRDWVRWGEERGMEIWDLNERVTKAAGGPTCFYIGLVRKFATNVWEISRRIPVLFMDSQSRNDEGSFRENADEGRYLNSMVGWNNYVTECSAMQHHSHGNTRLASDPPAEARMYTLSGIAGGWRPYHHHVSAYSEDRRQYEIAGPIFQWHKKYERYLIKRRPVVSAGVFRSDANAVFYGRNNAASLVQTPYRGIVHAFFRSRIPYTPLNIMDMEREAENLSVIVLPNIAAMSDQQCDFVRGFVERGGSLIATGLTSLYDTAGDPRPDFGLASVFGVHLVGAAPDRNLFNDNLVESYLRLVPRLGASGKGPRASGDTPAPGIRHAALAGLDDTNIIPFGGRLIPLRVDAGRETLMTYVSAPSSRPTGTQGTPEIPGLIVGTYGKGKVAFLPADLDRRYGADPLPDHATVMGNLLRWSAGDNVPLKVEGEGFIGSYLYRQENRLILHLLNGTGTDSGQEIISQYFPVGPLKVTVQIPDGVKAQNLKFLVAEKEVPPQGTRSVEFQVDQLVDHEVIVIE